MSTSRTLYEIEVALCNTDKFSYIKNIIAFNVIGVSSFLLINHECDMLVLSKSGYLTEIEIKRSWNDFIADFKKKHKHDSELIKYFYYCVPLSIKDKVYNFLEDKDIQYTGIITYDEELNIVINGREFCYQDNKKTILFPTIGNYRKLFIEERLELARYGAMRSVLLKKKINELLSKNESKLL